MEVGGIEIDPGAAAFSRTGPSPPPPPNNAPVAVGQQRDGPVEGGSGNSGRPTSPPCSPVSSVGLNTVGGDHGNPALGTGQSGAAGGTPGQLVEAVLQEPGQRRRKRNELRKIINRITDEINLECIYVSISPFLCVWAIPPYFEGND